MPTSQKHTSAPIGKYYATLFDHSPAMVVVWYSNEFVVEYLNPLADNFTSGKLRHGQSIYQFFPPEAKPFLRLLEQTFETGISNTAEELHVLMDPDGKGLQEYFLNISFQPLKNEEGEVLSVLNMIYDVSELVKARKFAEENEVRLRLAVESTGIGTWEYMPVTGALKWSDECRKIYGVPADMEIGMDFFNDYIYQEDKAFVNHAVEEAMQPGKGAYDIEFRIIHHVNHNIIWIRSVGKVFFENELAIRFIGVVMDITESKNRQKRLVENNERVQLVLESLPQIAWTATPEGDVNYVSARWFNFTGQSPEEGMNSGWSAVIHPDQRSQTIDKWKEMILNKAPFEMQTLIWYAEIKQYRWFWLKATPLKDAEGRIYLWTGTLTDYHEKLEFTNRLTEEVSKQTEALRTINKELIIQNEFIKAIINASAHLIIVFDKDLHLTEANAVCESRFGLKKEMVMGKHYLQIFPGTENTPTYKDLQEALKGKYIHNDVRQSDIMNGYFENHFIPLFRDNEVYGLVVIAHDITELFKTTEQLKHSEKFLQSVLNNTQNGIALYEPVYDHDDITDFKIIYSNQQGPSVLGIQPENIIGKMCSEIYPSIFLDGIFEKLIACVRTSMPMRYEVSFYHEREELFFTASINKLDNAVIVTTANITEEKKAEAKLAEANEKLSLQNKLLEAQNNELASFTYIASHDLQEPLRKIRTFCTLIFESSGDFSETNKNYFSRVIKAAERMQSLIEALLNYSKTSRDAETMETVSLHKVLEEVLENLQDEINEKNALINVERLPEMTIVYVQFIQLFTNIISNALKYNRPDVPCMIHIKSEIIEAGNTGIADAVKEKKYVKISFTDNGIGFDQQYEDKIFQLFQRLHGRAEYEGTGIGLAICKKVVQNHFGFIKAEGKKGEGSVFILYFPL